MVVDQLEQPRKLFPGDLSTLVPVAPSSRSDWIQNSQRQRFRREIRRNKFESMGVELKVHAIRRQKIRSAEGKRIDTRLDCVLASLPIEQGQQRLDFMLRQ